MTEPKKHRLLLAVSVVIAATIAALTMRSAHALVSPLAVSILAPVQFPTTGFTITGARVSAIWGEHRDVYGIDLAAIGNMTNNSFGGIAVSGVFNYNKGVSTIVALQAAGGVNYNVNKASVVGLQIAGLANINQAESWIAGLQFALANHSPFTKVYGFQVGVYNNANHVYGLQIGLVNTVQHLHGLQIGLINFNHSGPFSVAPILNVGF